MKKITYAIGRGGETPYEVQVTRDGFGRFQTRTEAAERIISEVEGEIAKLQESLTKARKVLRERLTTSQLEALRMLGRAGEKGYGFNLNGSRSDKAFSSLEKLGFAHIEFMEPRAFLTTAGALELGRYA